MTIERQHQIIHARRKLTSCCPFCGMREAQLWFNPENDTRPFQVRCAACGARGPECDCGEESAVPSWEGAFRDPKTRKDEPMTAKRIIAALEKVFAAEIEGRLPFQSKARIFSELARDGFLAPMTRTFGGRFPVSVTGWQLTHAGRILYCSECKEPEASI